MRLSKVLSVVLLLFHVLCKRNLEKALSQDPASKRTNTGANISSDQLLKIWKGLHYCMWMSDKPLVQEDLANNLAGLVHIIKDPDIALSFVEAYLHTQAREWAGIDQFRIDKFMMLMRRYWCESLVLLKNHAWSEELTEQLINVLKGGVLSTADGFPDGIRFHFADIFWDELEKVAAKEVSPDYLMTLLEPWCSLLSQTKNEALQKHVSKRIFEPPLSWSNSKRASGNNDDDEDDDDDEDAQCDVDLSKVCNRLFELGSNKTCSGKSRTCLYNLVKKYRSTIQGNAPSSLPAKATGPEIDPIADDIEKAAKRLQKMEKKIMQSSSKSMSKRERKRMRKMEEEEPEDVSDLEHEDGEDEKEDLYQEPPAKMKKTEVSPKINEKKKKKKSTSGSKENGENAVPGNPQKVTSHTQSASASPEIRKGSKSKTNSSQKRAALNDKNSSKEVPKEVSEKANSKNTTQKEVLAVKKISEGTPKEKKAKLKETKAAINSGIASDSTEKQPENYSKAKNKTDKKKGVLVDKNAGSVDETFESGALDVSTPKSKGVLDRTPKKQKTPKLNKKAKEESPKSLKKQSPKEGKQISPAKTSNAKSPSASTITNETMSVNDDTATPENQKKKKKRKSSGKSVSQQENSPTVSNETVTEDGEIEIWIPNKKYKGPQPFSPPDADSASKNKSTKSPAFAKFDKLDKTPVAFVNKAVMKATPKSSAKKTPKKRVKAENGLPESASSDKKRVSFIMTRNTAQEFEESLRPSPAPAFNPLTLPDTSILKASPASSPLLTPKQQLFKKKRRSTAADFF